MNEKYEDSDLEDSDLSDTDSDSEEPLYQAGTVPSVINFIWVGGPIPPKYLRSISSLAVVAKKSGFEINLWVDNELNYVKTSTREEITIPNLRVKNINELKDRLDTFLEPEDIIRFWEYVGREMVGFSNLAAASDFIRALILLEGGYYFDTDILFNLNENSQLVADYLPFGIKTRCDFHYRSVENKSDTTDNNVEISLIANFNNDVTGVTANHFVIEETISAMLRTYQAFDSNGGHSMDAKRMPFISKNKLDKRRQSTIYAGPGSMMEAMKSFIEEIGSELTQKGLGSMQVSDSFWNANGTISGINLTLKCDNSWLSNKRKSEQKAFDTNDLAPLTRRFNIERRELSQNDRQYDMLFNEIRSCETKNKTDAVLSILQRYILTTNSQDHLERLASVLNNHPDYVYLKSEGIIEYINLMISRRIMLLDTSVDPIVQKEITTDLVNDFVKNPKNTKNSRLLVDMNLVVSKAPYRDALAESLPEISLLIQECSNLAKLTDIDKEITLLSLQKPNKQIDRISKLIGNVLNKSSLDNQSFADISKKIHHELDGKNHKHSIGIEFFNSGETQHFTKSDFYKKVLSILDYGVDKRDELPLMAPAKKI